MFTLSLSPFFSNDKYDSRICIQIFRFNNSDGRQISSLSEFGYVTIQTTYGPWIKHKNKYPPTGHCLARLVYIFQL